MKKILLLILFLTCACSNIAEEVTTSQAEKNYEIKEISENNVIKYEYIIYGNDSNEMDKGIAFRISPNITKINETLQLCISEGTGLRNCKYYDVKANKKSEWFESPLLSNGTLVISFDTLTKPTGIVVQDIFNKNKFYKWYEINFSDEEVWPLIDIKFVNNNEIEITYVSDNNNKVETKIVKL